MAEKKRAYHSPLREQQAERTHQQIREAIVAQLFESGRTDFSFEDIAKRAGVNVRTVYRYFPTRDDLMAVADEEWAKHEPKFPHATSLDGLAHQTEQLFRYFEENRQFFEAAMTALAGQIEKRRRSKRTATLEAIVAKDAPHLELREAKKRAGILRLIGGSVAFRYLRGDVGLTAEEAADAAKWIIALAVRDTLKNG